VTDYLIQIDYFYNGMCVSTALYTHNR